MTHPYRPVPSEKRFERQWDGTGGASGFLMGAYLGFTGHHCYSDGDKVLGILLVLAAVCAVAANLWMLFQFKTVELKDDKEHSHS